MYTIMSLVRIRCDADSSIYKETILKYEKEMFFEEYIVYDNRINIIIFISTSFFLLFCA